MVAVNRKATLNTSQQGMRTYLPQKTAAFAQNSASSYSGGRTYPPKQNTRSQISPDRAQGTPVQKSGAASRQNADNFRRVQTEASRYIVTGSAAAQPKPEIKPQPKPQPKVRPQPKPQSQPVIQPGFGRHVLMIASVLFVFACAFFLIIRYVNISEQYIAINNLSKQIDETKIRINELSVDFECAIDLDKIREVAIKNGMGYPQGDQIIVLSKDAGSTKDNTDLQAAQNKG